MKNINRVTLPSHSNKNLYNELTKIIEDMEEENKNALATIKQAIEYQHVSNKDYVSIIKRIQSSLTIEEFNMHVNDLLENKHELYNLTVEELQHILLVLKEKEIQPVY